LQESRSAAAQFRQKPLLGKAQSPFSFNALEILHGRLKGVVCFKLQEDGAEVPIILAAFMPSAGSAIRKHELCGLSKDPSGAN
jgi:hypothetical protein